jgi:hypothetical protein
MPRTKGAKGKKTIAQEKALAESIADPPKLSPVNDSKQDREPFLPNIKRGRGRPKKVKLEVQQIINIDFKDIKQQIRAMQKLKKSCRPGSAERIDLHHKIKDLKKQLIERKEVNKEKEEIIVEILKYKPGYIKELNIDYQKFSIEQLNKHLILIKQRRSL